MPDRVEVQENERVPTHVCLDCGALGFAGGYHDHGNGNAGETIALKAIPAWVRSWQRIERAKFEAEEEVERLEGALRMVAGAASFNYATRMAHLARLGYSLEELERAS